MNQRKTMLQLLEEAEDAVKLNGYRVKHLGKNYKLHLTIPMQICISLYNPRSGKTKKIYFLNGKILIKWAMKNGLLDNPTAYRTILRKNDVKTIYV